jgi:hypothetical protein
MPIYIAKTRNGYVEDAVLADNSALAQAYWQGKGILADSITERSEQDLQGHSTGVISIVSTTRRNIPEYGPGAKEYLLVSKA